MRFHKILVNAVNYNLKQIFSLGKQADKVIENCLKSNKNWGSRDRSFIAETTYDIVRWVRLYDYCLRGKPYFEAKTIADFYGIIAVYFILKDIELPNWDEFKGLNKDLIKQRNVEAFEKSAIINAIPDWLQEKGLQQLQDCWQQNIMALNRPAQTIIRVNTLKITTAQLFNKLTDTGIICSIQKQYPDAIFINEKLNLFKTDYFKNGYFELQDANSQMVAAFLNPKPGQKIIDACAGAGGKTLHLAALMQNKGKIMSMDTALWKLDELVKRAKRAGAFNIETKCIAEENSTNSFYNYADKLLLDVPCSGLGVLKRNPDSKWKLSERFIDEVVLVQQKILNNYSKMLKPGGELVYATCSILPQENSLQIKEFLQHNDSFTLIEEKQLYPADTGFDGFYMAKLKHTG